jgi:broad specificity phosphatase PhoE
MSMQTRWWWVRHAPVPDGGRIYGQGDPSCDCSDTAVFADLAAVLPADAVWVTSHLVRTLETARAIHAADPEKFVGVDLTSIPALAEQHLGEWQGRDRKAFYAERKVGTHSFWFAPADERPPGGESFVDMVGRVSGAVESLTRAHNGRDIVAVAHGGTIRAALGHALRIPAQAALAFATDNCALTRLDHLPGADGSGLWRVVMVNRGRGSRGGAVAPAAAV